MSTEPKSQSLKEFWDKQSKTKKFFIILPFILIFAYFADPSNSNGLSICECKENYWDPNNLKYGEVMSLENTGNLGGSNLVKRRDMYNVYNAFVPFESLSESDKTIREKCRDTYLSDTEVMMSKCD